MEKEVGKMQASEVTRSEICQQLREHYRRISKEVGEFNIGIYAAIDAYEKEPELLNAYQRMIEMYQFEVRQREKEQDELLRLKRLLEKRDIQLKYHTECTSDYAKESIRIERGLRSLMDSYIKRQEKLHKEIEEAKRDGDVDAEMTGEALYRQMRHVIAELFQTMKKIGILDDEEIKFGCVKEAIQQ